MYQYGAPCAMNGMGWANEGFYGLGAATPAQRQAAQAQRQQAAAARKAARAVKVAGRTVKTTANNNAPERMAQIMNQLKAASSAAMQKAQVAQQAISRAKQTRNPRDRQNAVAATRAAQSTASGVLQQLKTAHSGGLAPAPAPTKLRGMGYGDGMHLDGFGDCTDGNDPSTGAPYVDYNSACGGGGGSTYQSTYPQQSVYGGNYGGSQYSQYPQQLNTGITSGFSQFGSGGGMFPQMATPAGCNTGSNLPRCLIFSMAQSEQTQMMFVFSVMEQMYAQLLQIVNQLMTQLQSVSQQPPPYYGQQSPYGPYGQQPYGQSPYDPYGQGQYGGNGPYGYGSPYGPSSSQIPPGYDAGSGDGSIPTDITQAFPGPGPMPGGIPSSDGPLPIGAGPGGGGDSSVDDTGNVMAAQIPGQMPVNMSQAPGQSVNYGPNQPVPIIISVQSPGQSPYADAGISQAPQVNQGGDGMVSAEDWEN